jgi:hypothetical protein
VGNKWERRFVTTTWLPLTDADAAAPSPDKWMSE